MNAKKSDRSRLLKKALCILIPTWPCALSVGSRTWPILAVWAFAGSVRWRYADPKVLQDSLLFGLINVLLLRKELLEVVEKRWTASDWLRDITSHPLTVLIALAVCGFSLWQMVRNSGPESATRISPTRIPKKTLEYPKPLIFPCRTTHARIFPKKHAFGYTYLLCGFPIIPTDIVDKGTGASGGSDTRLGSWWLQVRAEDYLELGHGSLGFYKKLSSFLTEHDVADSEWCYAYLVTAPRFFGYSFNPVSFWYIYNRDHELKKMILEVNNTFGEKRMYLLDDSSPQSPPETPGLSTDDTKSRFFDIWVKDFHVSPFNSRQGSYALKALNPFPYPKFTHPKVDNTITLKSSKGHGKLVARVHTTGKPLDSTQLGVLATLRFVASWWWVGLVTFPRIIREAFKLYFQRGLHVWFRPEVLSSSLGRAPAAYEVSLYGVFQDYLGHLVRQSTDSFNIKCETAIPDRPRQTVTTIAQDGSDNNSKSLELRISTPAFYSRFVHYAHTCEAFDRECLFTDAKNRTLWISKPGLLPALLPKSSARRSQTPVQRSCLSELRWRLLKRLRCPPAAPAYAVTPTMSGIDIDDIRALPYSDLDKFVRGSGGSAHSGAYRRVVTKIFLAQRYAFGFVEVIDAVDLSLRALLCLIGTTMLIDWAQHTRDFASFDTGEPNKALHQFLSSRAGSRLGLMSITAVYVCGCHIYGLLKGYT